mgnify:CR=1 FL=1
MCRSCGVCQLLPTGTAGRGAMPSTCRLACLDLASIRSVVVPLALIGATADEAFVAHDLLSRTTFTWRGSHNYVRLDPGLRQAHVFALTRAGSPYVM